MKNSEKHYNWVKKNILFLQILFPGFIFPLVYALDTVCAKDSGEGLWPTTTGYVTERSRTGGISA